LLVKDQTQIADTGASYHLVYPNIILSNIEEIDTKFIAGNNMTISRIFEETYTGYFKSEYLKVLGLVNTVISIPS
jgi:hypothetical protein